WKAATPFAGQVAHGWGLAVGNQISPRTTPELAEAFTKTLEYRKPWEANNSGSWTGSFSAKFWARLGNEEMLQKVLDEHFEKALFPNLTSNFGGFWEIDGNLGITASICEMLLQIHDGVIEFLPALPSFYPNGKVEGLKARGGFTVNMEWNGGILKRVRVHSQSGGKAVLRYGEQLR
uniref:glycoside hydrolase family 95-like protein n=1 Tax=Arenibacter certesii TaxID=228955 RepID=UPI00047CF799